MTLRIKPPTGVERPGGEKPAGDLMLSHVAAARPVEVARRASTPTGSAPGPTASADAHAIDAVVVVERLNVYYGSFRAIRDIGLTIRRHAVTAIIGPSGCG
jgi:ABC-type glutathione transport system ATPase component